MSSSIASQLRPKVEGVTVWRLADDAVTLVTEAGAEARLRMSKAATGPHVMLVGAAAHELAQGYPREHEADPSKRYVMWPDRPFEHLMLPVE